jgi:branched-chain amino acid transport system permease protein
VTPPRRSSRLPAALTLAVVLLVIVLPWMLRTDYSLSIAILFMAYLPAALGLNLIMGYGGEVNLAQAPMFALAGYTTGILTVKTGVPFIAAVPAALLVTALFALAVAAFSLRLAGLYFAFASFALGELVRTFLRTAADLTEGELGLTGIPMPDVLGAAISSPVAYYYFAAAIAGIAYGFTALTVRSFTGKTLVAVRENALLARAIGVNPFRYKLIAFVICAVCTGIGGILYAHHVQLLTPDLASVTFTNDLLMMVILGGSGTIAGPLLGTAFLTVLPEYLRVVGEFRLLIYGALLVLAILFVPSGMAGMLGEHGSLRWLTKVVRPATR